MCSGSYPVPDKCEHCSCSRSDHVQVAEPDENGRLIVSYAECSGSYCRCRKFETYMGCGGCMECGWGGKGPPPPPVSNDRLYQLAALDGTLGAPMAFSNRDRATAARRELVRRGMPDPWTPGSTAGSAGRDRSWNRGGRGGR